MDDFCQKFFPTPEAWKVKAPTDEELAAYKATRNERRRAHRRHKRTEAWKERCAFRGGDPIPLRDSAAKRFLARAESAAAYLLSTIRR